MVEVPLDHLHLLMEVPQVHLALQEAAIQVPLVTWVLKANLDSHSCGKVFLLYTKALQT